MKSQFFDENAFVHEKSILISKRILIKNTRKRMF